MNWLFRSLNSSIGKKILMALTGTFLILFLIGHLLGNLQLFAPNAEEALNNYAHFLKQFGAILEVIEIVLGLIFLFHIVNSIVLTISNKKARPQKYAVNASSKNSTFSSRTMIWTGSIVGIFLIVHLRNFWYEFAYAETASNLFELVVKTFQDPIYSGFYIFAMILLGFHLNHGFQSAFQTFGLNHKKYTPVINFLGAAFSFLIAAGFASMPIYYLFFYGG